MFLKVHPYFSIPGFYIAVTISFIYRFMFGNLYGIFITCIILYNTSELFLGTTPLNYIELICWILEQSEATTTAILSSIITITGFLIAYATATSNWKGQILANIKVQAAGEIDAFFEECSNLTTDCNIYAKALVKAVNEIQDDCKSKNGLFLSHYNREQGKLIKPKIDRLILLSAKIYRLKGRYNNLLISVPGLKAALDSATQALTNIADKLFFLVPFHIEGDKNPIQSFLQQVDIIKCTEFINAVEMNQGDLSFSFNNAKLNLMSPVVGYNFWTLMNFYRGRKMISKNIADRYNKYRKNKG